MNANIRQSSTMPADFYTSVEAFERCREIFSRSWQFICMSDRLNRTGQVLPLTVLDGFLDEPIVLSRAEHGLHCLANVCTHRGTVVVQNECETAFLRCRYHGRRFGLDGSFISSPGFEDAQDFPTAQDNLPSVACKEWKGALFACPSPNEPLFPFAELIRPLSTRLNWLPLDRFVYAPHSARDYVVDANWALYCDNYLEGLHIPFVHPSLAASIDCRNYTTEVFDYGSLQLGLATSSGEAFALPESAPDFGKTVGAYWFFLFPNMMFNFYPWGLSLNIVVPLTVKSTRVTFLTFVGDESRFDRGAQPLIDLVEREDEEVVHLAQRGVRSRFYQGGRYAPSWESGLFHFHSLLRRFLAWHQ